MADEAAKKGYLRSVHSRYKMCIITDLKILSTSFRIITNSEEIAFYEGDKMELSHLSAAFKSLVKQSNKIYIKRLWYIMLEQFLMKYGWTGAGMILISIPILTSKKSATKVGAETGVSERTEYYTIAKHLLMAGGDAMERLMTAYKEVVELAGYTQRVANMFDVFDDCSKSR